MSPHMSPVSAVSPSTVSPPLFVDLDGSLLATDSLHEALLRLAATRPAALLSVPRWLALGKAGFKTRVAQAAALDPATLPYRPEVIEFLRREKAAGRRIVLATGAHRRIAEGVARHLGLFDQVLATDEETNLTADRKLAAIERAADGPFDYIGNGRVDAPIWARARRSLTVALPPAAGRALAARGVVTEPLVPWRSLGFGTVLRALRVHQWSKNLLLIVPVGTAHLLGEPWALTAVLTGVLAFSLTASAIYLLNDLADLAHDRAHPTKRARPLAAGEFPLALAAALVPLLLAAGGALASRLPLEFGGLLAGYLVLTTAYSFRLKRVMALDTVVLALLYALRIGAGAATVHVSVSTWLFAFSLFLFLSLALIKRASELVVMQQGSVERAKGRGYQRGDLDAVSALGAASAYTAVLVFALYVDASPDVRELYTHPHRLYAVCPILLYWLSRVWILAHRGEILDDPVVFAIRDRVSYLAFALIVAVTVLAS